MKTCVESAIALVAPYLNPVVSWLVVVAYTVYGVTITWTSASRFWSMSNRDVSQLLPISRGLYEAVSWSPLFSSVLWGICVSSASIVVLYVNRVRLCRDDEVLTVALYRHILCALLAIVSIVCLVHLAFIVLLPHSKRAEFVIPLINTAMLFGDQFTREGMITMSNRGYPVWITAVSIVLVMIVVGSRSCRNRIPVSYRLLLCVVGLISICFPWRIRWYDLYIIYGDEFVTSHYTLFWWFAIIAFFVPTASSLLWISVVLKNTDIDSHA